MSEIDRHPPGTFCWAEIGTSDVECSAGPLSSGCWRKAETMRARILWLMAALSLVLPARAAAQAPAVTLPPAFVLPNYDRIQLGKREGLEGGAYVARTSDAAAAWYNPAGLASSRKSGIDASAVAYEWVTLNVHGLRKTTSRSRFSSVATLVAGVLGAPVIHSDRWRLGFALAAPVAWQPGTIDDDAVTYPIAGATERMAFAAAVRLVTMVPSLAVGYTARPGLRFGASLDGIYTSLAQGQTISDRFLTADSLETMHRTFSSDGSTTGGRLTVGMQWEFLPSWSLGAVVGSPVARLWGSSLLSFDASLTNRSGVGDLYFRDDGARFEYRESWRILGGVAWHSERAAIEADVRYHGGTSEYSLYESDDLAHATVAPAGAPPTTSLVPFGDTPYKARPVLNAALGGNFMLNRAWTVHLGVFTDESPVADPQTSTLRKADLVGLTGGVTLQGTHLTGALGLGYSRGESGTVRVATLTNGGLAETTMRVQSMSILYALAYTF